MIIVTGEARFADGEIERLRGPLNAWVEEVRGRDGCLAYCYGVDLADPNLLHLTEKWRDLAAIEAHMAAMDNVMALLAGANMVSLNVHAYDARFTRTLMGE